MKFWDAPQPTTRRYVVLDPGESHLARADTKASRTPPGRALGACPRPPAPPGPTSTRRGRARRTPAWPRRRRAARAPAAVAVPRRGILVRQHRQRERLAGPARGVGQRPLEHQPVRGRHGHVERGEHQASPSCLVSRRQSSAVTTPSLSSGLSVARISWRVPVDTPVAQLAHHAGETVLVLVRLEIAACALAAEPPQLLRDPGRRHGLEFAALLVSHVEPLAKPWKGWPRCRRIMSPAGAPRPESWSGRRRPSVTSAVGP